MKVDGGGLKRGFAAGALVSYLGKYYIVEYICVKRDGPSVVPSLLHAHEAVISSCLGQLMTGSHHCCIRILKDYILIVWVTNLI